MWQLAKTMATTVRLDPNVYCVAAPSIESIRKSHTTVEASLSKGVILDFGNGLTRGHCLRRDCAFEERYRLHYFCIHCIFVVKVK